MLGWNLREQSILKSLVFQSRYSVVQHRVVWLSKDPVEDISTKLHETDEQSESVLQVLIVHTKQTSNQVKYFRPTCRCQDVVRQEKEAKEKNAVFLKESDEILKKTGVETIATPRYDMTEDIETLLKTFLQHEEEFSEGFVKAFEAEDGPVSLEDAFSQAPILGF